MKKHLAKFLKIFIKILKPLDDILTVWSIAGYLAVLFVIVAMIFTDYRPSDLYVILMCLIVMLQGFNILMEHLIKRKSIGRCPSCGGQLVWMSDFDAEDYGHEEEGIVTNYTCSKCEIDVTHFVKL